MDQQSSEAEAEPTGLPVDRTYRPTDESNQDLHQTRAKDVWHPSRIGLTRSFRFSAGPDSFEFGEWAWAGASFSHTTGKGMQGYLSGRCAVAARGACHSIVNSSNLPGE